VSIGFKAGLPLQQICDLVDEEGARGAELIALPETHRGQNDQSPESLVGPTASTMAGWPARRGRHAAARPGSSPVLHRGRDACQSGSDDISA